MSGFDNPWGGTGATPARPDPLVLDLNRDKKIELKNVAFFDLNANGFHEFTRWIDKTDAFLRAVSVSAVFPNNVPCLCVINTPILNIQSIFV